MRKEFDFSRIKKNKIVIYKTSKGPELKVRLEKETIWLTQAQIASLFSIERSVITKHLRNIFKDGELDKKSNVQKIHIPNSDKPVNFYNLDIIISVGYRVNSKQATQFRVWATKILRNYLINGYAINEKRLLSAQEKFKELQNAISFLQEKSKHKLLAGQEQEIFNLLSSYSKSLTILEQYDKGLVRIIKGKRAKFVLSYSDAIRIIANIKNQLLLKKEASNLFGQEYKDKFEAVIKGLYQTFGGKELYNSIEIKSTHLLRFLPQDF